MACIASINVAARVAPPKVRSYAHTTSRARLGLFFRVGWAGDTFFFFFFIAAALFAATLFLLSQHPYQKKKKKPVGMNTDLPSLPSSV